MSSLAALCETANVGIGSKFKSQPLNPKGATKAAIVRWMKSRGMGAAYPKMSGSKLDRARLMWKKLKLGLIKPECAVLIRRDYAKEFAVIEREELAVAKGEK